MNANAIPVLSVFQKKMSLEVPLFQRQYVWNEGQQWQPLWDDIALKFTQTLQGRKDAPVHFLGAMVLDQKQVPITHVEKRQIIDGQQRLTTLQIFLAAFRDYCKAKELSELAAECSTFTFNTGMMANKETDKFKVWPTQADRPQFIDVIELGSPEAIQKKHPLVRKKYQRKPLPRPRMVEAYLFFYEQIELFFASTDEVEELENIDLATRIEECLSTLKDSLRVVVIDLDKDDDAQVIFETLNARGEPLLPADLLRNFIFLRVAREDRSAEQLYNEYWAPFDNEFWRQEIRQGRLSRPRSDLFMQHFLTSRQALEIPIKNLFVEYRYWIVNARPFESVVDELAMLARQRKAYRELIQPTTGSPLKRLAGFLQVFDMSTIYPFLLRLSEFDLTSDQWKEITSILESYVLRRAVCGLTNKNYNSVFLGLTRLFKSEPFSIERMQQQLLNLRGESTSWPTDEEFRVAWRNQHAYSTLNNVRLTFILNELSGSMLGIKSEDITINVPLTVEHLLPQNWIENWPLASGEKGLTFMEKFDADPKSERFLYTELRNAALHTMGNLTLLTAPLNTAVSNGSWTSKKPAILKSSLLPINQSLHDYDAWDEDAISKRSDDLFEFALKLWRRPA